MYWYKLGGTSRSHFPALFQKSWWITWPWYVCETPWWTNRFQWSWNRGVWDILVEKVKYMDLWKGSEGSRKLGHSAIALQKREEMMHFSRWKSQGCEGCGESKGREEVIRSKRDGQHRSAASCLLGPGPWRRRPWNGLSTGHPRCTRLVSKSFSQSCLQLSAKAPATNGTAGG